MILSRDTGAITIQPNCGGGATSGEMRQIDGGVPNTQTGAEVGPPSG